MTASKEPSALTWAARSFVAAMLARSPTTTASALGSGLLRVRRARVVARMQDDLVALIGEKLADHQAEAVGRTGDEDARHAVLPMLCFGYAYRSPCRLARRVAKP